MKRIILALFLCFLLSGCSLINLDFSNKDDMIADVNAISSDIMKANIKIKVTFVNSFDIISGYKQGSGFIYEASGNSYEAISNAHVFTNEDWKVKKIEIFDYTTENSYTGKLINIDVNKDMATLSFKGNNDYPLKAISFADKLPDKNAIVYAIGAPLGQVNNLTIGRYLGLTDNIPNNNFGFELIYSTAPIDHGNSGGMLLNEDLLVIGMNTAELESNNGVYCGSIPFNELTDFIGS